MRKYCQSSWSPGSALASAALPRRTRVGAVSPPAGTGTQSEADFQPPRVPIAVLDASGHILMALGKLSRWRPVGGPQRVTADLRSSWTAFSGGFNEDRARRQHWASVAGGSPERKGRDLWGGPIRTSRTSSNVMPFHSLQVSHLLGSGSLTRLGVLRLVIPLPRTDDVQVADSRRSLLVRPVIVRRIGTRGERALPQPSGLCFRLGSLIPVDEDDWPHCCEVRCSRREGS